jgi:hypothetical protein
MKKKEGNGEQRRVDMNLETPMVVKLIDLLETI